MKTVKIISITTLTAAYISLSVAGFMEGLQTGLVVFSLLSVFFTRYFFRCISTTKKVITTKNSL